MGKDEKLSIGFLFDDTLDSNDGVAQYVKALGSWLSGHGHDVSYLVGETKLENWAGGQVHSMSKNQRVVFNGNHLSIPLPVPRSRIKQVLKKHDFDVLHVQVPYSPFMAQKVINSANSKMAVVGTFHILPANKLASVGSRVLKLLYGKSLKRFDEIISVSSPAAGFAKRAFGIQSDVVPNVVDVAKFSSATPMRITGQPTIVFLGRLVERKGCRQLLEAFKLMHPSLPGAKLIIAGDGPQRRQLETYIRRNSLENHVKFLGFIDEKDKSGLLASADVACFPSTGGESFGIVLIEAMAAGAGVVVGGNNPGYTSVLAGKPELLFNPNDHQVFADHLLKLLTDRQLSQNLHVWQQKEVQRYDVNEVGEQLLAIYRQAIAKRRNRRHN